MNEFINFLKLLKKEKLNELIAESELNRELLPIFKARSEAQWKEFYQLEGVDIYNYLHPIIGKLT